MIDNCKLLLTTQLQGGDNTNNYYSKTQMQDVDDEEVYVQYVFAIYARIQEMRNEATAN